ncbi:hypothetical protein NT6N_02490 [Oceaniferula spumae]|uniref:Ice-binding protein C-terminal domain-containing protein n=1 Tax=Oceaniferula spumae TaxID=2979115 RepID=A0AAT9FH27_9BACT
MKKTLLTMSLVGLSSLASLTGATLVGSGTHLVAFDTVNDDVTVVRSFDNFLVTYLTFDLGPGSILGGTLDLSATFGNFDSTSLTIEYIGQYANGEIAQAGAGNNDAGTAQTIANFDLWVPASAVDSESFDPVLNSPGQVASFTIGASTDQIAVIRFTGTSSTATNQQLTVSNPSAVFTPVPEPSSAALLGLGGLTLVLRRRK